MRVLAHDSGAERMGWSVLEGDGQTAPVYIDSGIERFPFNKKLVKYQSYKLDLIRHYTHFTPAMLVKYDPDAVVFETLPAVGFNNAIQAELAKAATVTAMAMAIERDYPVYQIAAVTVKKAIGGKQKASKVQVRNGVIELLPILEPRKFEWTDGKKTMDEPDGIAIGLTHLGYSVLRKLT